MNIDVINDMPRYSKLQKRVEKFKTVFGLDKEDPCCLCDTCQTYVIETAKRGELIGRNRKMYALLCFLQVDYLGKPVTVQLMACVPHECRADFVRALCLKKVQRWRV